MAEEIHLALDEEMERTLEAVRQQQGLETKEIGRAHV